MIFEWELNANKTTKELKENTPPYCAWCGGQCDQPRPFPNRRGELFCSTKASGRSPSTMNEWIPVKENTIPDCAWCGGQCDQPRPFPNRRGELFCSASHRSSSNRALKRLLSK